jgi:hypothetical protein
MLFVVSAASTSAALMILLAEKSKRTMPGLLDLHRMDASKVVEMKARNPSGKPRRLLALNIRLWNLPARRMS